MNVLDILDRYNIEYVDSGRNVAKGNVNVQCPWCGEADHSQHLGINLESGMWGCWRNAKHRGRKLYRLLAKLAGLSSGEARRATGEGALRAIERGAMESAVSALSEGPTDSVYTVLPSNIQMDDKFRRICRPGAEPYAAEKRFRRYLHKDRGFPMHHHKYLASRYDLHYCVHGPFADRLIIPVWENGKLMTYLGRSVYSAASLRYLALEKEKSVKQVKDCLFNFDEAKHGGTTLFIVEGAFDAMKIDFYGHKRAVHAVGLFNMNVEEAQALLFYELRDLYDNFVILLDEGEIARSHDLQTALTFLGIGKVCVWFLRDDEASDPAELTPKQVREFIKGEGYG